MFLRRLTDLLSRTTLYKYAHCLNVKIKRDLRYERDGIFIVILLLFVLFSHFIKNTRQEEKQIVGKLILNENQ